MHAMQAAEKAPHAAENVDHGVVSGTPGLGPVRPGSDPVSPCVTVPRRAARKGTIAICRAGVRSRDASHALSCRCLRPARSGLARLRCGRGRRHRAEVVGVARVGHAARDRLQAGRRHPRLRQLRLGQGSGCRPGAADPLDRPHGHHPRGLEEQGRSRPIARATASSRGSAPACSRPSRVSGRHRSASAASSAACPPSASRRPPEPAARYDPSMTRSATRLGSCRSRYHSSAARQRSISAGSFSPRAS
jgi:hypothetical protein